jgi:hypothetical protein
MVSSVDQNSPRSRRRLLDVYHGRLQLSKDQFFTPARSSA